MIIVMQPNAPQESIDRVVVEIGRMGAAAHLSKGISRTVIGAVGEEGNIDETHLRSLDGVEKVVPIMKPYKLASREFHEEDSIVEVGGGSRRARSRRSSRAWIGRGRGRRCRRRDCAWSGFDMGATE